jgi:signal recognition particle subunit SRP68
MHLTRCYALVHKYAEALTLIQYANLHLRETRFTLSLSGSDPITSGEPAFYPFSTTSVDELESDLTILSLQLKKDWLAYNGGSANANDGPFKKPLFFDIALNYVQLDMDNLQGRAGRKPEATASVPVDASSKAEKQSEKKQTAKAMEEVRPVTPEPQPVARGGLSNLLGGWWGRS